VWGGIVLCYVVQSGFVWGGVEVQYVGRCGVILCHSVPHSIILYCTVLYDHIYLQGDGQIHRLTYVQIVTVHVNKSFHCIYKDEYVQIMYLLVQLD
jgi:hypothetical protein